MKRTFLFHNIFSNIVCMQFYSNLLNSFTFLQIHSRFLKIFFYLFRSLSFLGCHVTYSTIHVRKERLSQCFTLILQRKSCKNHKNIISYTLHIYARTDECTRTEYMTRLSYDATFCTTLSTQKRTFYTGKGRIDKYTRKF